MAYSNGYDQSAVITALKDRVGFRQPLGAGVPTLTSAVTTSNSGRYFQDFHGLVTVENIKATMEQVNASDGDLITHLGNIRSAAIMRALNAVFNEMQIIDQPAKVFNRYGHNDQLIANSGKFVGYRIVVADSADVATQIDLLLLYLNEAKTFNVYLFKDGEPAPLVTQSVTTVADKVTECALTAEKILNRGIYYLGYFQNDLGTAKAYNEQVKSWSNTRFFRAQPMEATSTGATTFDRENIAYPARPLALNVEMSSFRDHTIQIKRKAAMFDELIGLALSYHVIEQVMYAVRSNVNERILKDQVDKFGLQLDLNGVAPFPESPKVMGLKQRIDREGERVRKSFYPADEPVSVNLQKC